ncbi:DNA replication/repair protein RecF [Peptoanaerobacter stomatis]|uniref:DNA replication/repair protein RecF n=1 Tax=Peptoanaerobacter stomatis TaxID=796937 RepID=UPI003FA146A0
MIIKSLVLSDFRNIENINIEFGQGLNIIYGDNAQGKTNILESIYAATTTKSHKNSKDKEMITIGKDESHVRIIFNKNGLDRKVDMHLKKSKSKAMAIDGIPVHKSSDVFGIAQLILFSPEDLNMIKNGPAERRRFIDMELSQINRIYLYNLSKYNKILVQRNNLLKQISNDMNILDTLDVWDEQLVQVGAEIIKNRRKFISELDEIIKPIHSRLTGGKEELQIEYNPNVIEEDFSDKLKRGRSSDIYNKTTLIGPQRDDVTFYINKNDVRKYGSQGQQRSTALSLKLSEIELFKKKTGDNPILLLDDVLSELDRSRQNYLIESIGDIQTIITCTGLEEFVENKKADGRIYKINSGKIDD